MPVEDGGEQLLRGCIPLHMVVAYLIFYYTLERLRNSPHPLNHCYQSSPFLRQLEIVSTVLTTLLPLWRTPGSDQGKEILRLSVRAGL